MISASSKSARRRWLIVIGVLGLLAVVAVWAVRGFGRWLVVSDPLQPARAIVVLAGEAPYRAEEAAKLYRQGLAPEVWLTHDPPNIGLERLGIEYRDKTDYSAQALMKLGVPSTAIRYMPKGTHNTHEEELGILQELRTVGGGRIILVSSPFHTRRVRAIWHQIAGSSFAAIVRPDTDEPIDPDHWWRNPEDAKAAGHEFLGLLNAWVGYPVRQRETD